MSPLVQIRQPDVTSPEYPSAGEVDISSEGIKENGSAATDDTSAPGVSSGDRLVILTQTLQLEVKNTTATVEAIRTLAKDAGGTITELSITSATEGPVYRYDEYGSVEGSGIALRGWITVRVPADTVDEFTQKRSCAWHSQIPSRKE